MQDQKVSDICDTVMHFFKNTVTQIDKSVKFVKRKSKLGAQLFAETLVMGFLSDPKMSLEGLCRLIKKRGIKITKQAFSERFNKAASELLQGLFKEASIQFKTKNVAVIDLLKPFSTVQILDSTGVSLPDALQDRFQGFGGGASKSGIKLQVLLDYVDGQVAQAVMTEARKNDQSFNSHLTNLQKGGLYLQDLGYFSIDSLRTIDAAGAYFVTRYLSQTNVYDNKSEVIALHKKLRKAGSSLVKKVYLGRGKEKLAVRLIAHRLPDTEAEKHIKKIKKCAKKKGYKAKKETLELAKWSICITNIPETLVKDEEVYLVYSLRWQVELFFKLCKSLAGIDKIQGKTVNRILCELYAKLIGVMLLLYCCSLERWQENQEISFYKAYKYLRDFFADFFKALSSAYRLLKVLKEFLVELKEFGLKEKPRKKRKSTYQKMMAARAQEVLA